MKNFMKCFCILSFSLIVLTHFSCKKSGSGQAAQDGVTETPQDGTQNGEEQNPAAQGGAATTQPDATTQGAATGTGSVFGTWRRTASYTNNQPNENSGGTLIIGPQGYSSTAGDCTHTGSVAVQGSSFQQTIKTATCEGINVGQLFTGTFQISNGGKNLTVTNNQFGSAVREEFTKVSDDTGSFGGSAGSGETGGGGGATDVGDYCDFSQGGAKSCEHYAGSAWTTETKQTFCNNYSGVLSSTPCPTADLLGRCSFNTPATHQRIQYYYKGNPLATVGDPGQLCSNMHGEWQAN